MCVISKAQRCMIKQRHVDETHHLNTYSLLTGDLAVPATRTLRYGPRSFAMAGPSTSNSLQEPLHSCHLISSFRRALKTELFIIAYHQHARDCFLLQERANITFGLIIVIISLMQQWSHRLAPVKSCATALRTDCIFRQRTRRDRTCMQQLMNDR